jgi:hypothetical protein
MVTKEQLTQAAIKLSELLNQWQKLLNMPSEQVVADDDFAK